MNPQNIGDPLNPSDNTEKNDLGVNYPIVNFEPGSDKAPVDAALIPEMPQSSITTVVAPTSEANIHEASVSESKTLDVPVGANAGSPAALLNREDSEHLRTRWNEIQGKFVDEPRSAVQQADALVSEVVEKITQMFASEHSSLESQWNQGIDVSTEDLRKALQHYRSFFNRLVV
jgi:predicted NAD-dependent protein-ADP-ribosyltransferase YbiA (DUF1768 family)